MTNKTGSLASSVPTPLAGLALGVAGLGAGLDQALSLPHHFGQYTGGLLALIMLLPVLVKFFARPALLLEELRHPVLGSILPAATMTLMLLAKTLGMVSPRAGEALWVVAVLLHVVLLCLFVFFRARSFSLGQLLPIWMLPVVGLGVATITVPDARYQVLAYGIMLFATFGYLVMLPFVMYRLAAMPPMPDPVQPTIAILAAPASLVLVAYLAVEPNPSQLLVSLILGLAVFMTALVYGALYRQRRLPFTPAFASYTFPLVISASALYALLHQQAETPLVLAYGTPLRVLAGFEMGVAAVVVGYVCVRYILHYTAAR
ncbi:MAG: TDT family transporter [Desulfobulbus sp.]|jgi:exfoliative toxin A/B